MLMIIKKDTINIQILKLETAKKSINTFNYYILFYKTPQFYDKK